MARVTRIRIRGTDDHTCKPRLDNRIRAGWRTPVRAARLQGHIQRRTSRKLRPFQRAQGLDFRMWPASAAMPPFRDRMTAFHDHRTHRRIRRCISQSPPRLSKGEAHESFVVREAHSASLPAYSSRRKLPRFSTQGSCIKMICQSDAPQVYESPSGLSHRRNVINDHPLEECPTFGHEPRVLLAVLLVEFVIRHRLEMQ